VHALISLRSTRFWSSSAATAEAQRSPRSATNVRHASVAASSVYLHTDELVRALII